MKKLKCLLNPASVLFIGIFIVAAILRLYRLEAYATFLGDQGRDAIIIKRIVTLEHLTAIGPPSSVGQVFLGPFYYYLVAPFLLLTHLHPIGLVIGVAFFTLIGFAMAYVVLKKDVNTVTATLFSILLAFSSVNIDLARFSWNPNLLPLFAFFTLYFWERTLNSKKMWYAVLFGAFFSASFQLHHLAMLMILPIGLSLVLQILKEKKISKEEIKKMGISVISFLTVISPLIFFDLKNHFLNSSNFIRTFTHENILSSTRSSFSDRFAHAANALFLHSFKITTEPWIGGLLFIVLAVGCVFLYKKTTNQLIKIHVLNLILFVLGFSLLQSERHMHYYGTVYYSLLLVLAYLLSFLFKNKALRYTVLPLLLVGYIACNATNYYFFYKTPNNQMRDAQKIAESIVPHIDKTPFQTVPLPISVTDGHVRYFLEIEGHRPLDVDSPVEGEELFVMCYYNNPCVWDGNPQWQIASFKNAKLDTMWKLELVTIYKVVHKQK